MKIIMRLMLSLQPAQPQARGRARPGGNPNLRGSGVVALEDAALEFNAANPGDRHNFTPSRAMGGGARATGSGARCAREDTKIPFPLPRRAQSPPILDLR